MLRSIIKDTQNFQCVKHIRNKIKNMISLFYIVGKYLLTTVLTSLCTIDDRRYTNRLELNEYIRDLLVFTGLYHTAV